jgi:eukaryotic-like serine/threonine-protein kinase
VARPPNGLACACAPNPASAATKAQQIAALASIATPPEASGPSRDPADSLRKLHAARFRAAGNGNRPILPAMPGETETDTGLLPPRYRDVVRIGRGGMGDIYRATDSVLGRDVAVKVLAERYAQDESIRSRFTREALAAARLSGAPATVTIFDVGEHEGRPFIVMEYLPGGSLEERVRSGAQEPGRAIGWLEQAGAALDAAHATGIVHRDVKPANLLLDADENVHVADFGIASATGMDSMTKTGTVLGTAGYLAPEQALGERTTPASDRYALGVVGYELLTGRRPFENETPTAEAAAHVHAPVPPISEQGLPEELDPVFERALAKEPASRFASCAEFVAEIRDAFSRAATATRILAPVAARAPEPEPARAARPPGGRSRPWPLLAAGGIAALLAGGALAAVLTGGDDPAAQTTGPSTLVTTVVQTEPGTTEQVTVTATVPPAQEGDGDGEAGEGEGEGGGEGEEQPAGSVDQGIALTDEATSLLGQDDERALALALQAIPMLEGNDNTYTAYANYDAGRALANLGRCDEALVYLDRSEALQGSRKEIRQARKDCGG